MTGSSYTGSLSSVVGNHTISATYGSESMSVDVYLGCTLTRVNKSLMSSITIKYSTDGSSYTTLDTISASNWVSKTSYYNYTNTITISGVTQGPTHLYIKLSSSLASWLQGNSTITKFDATQVTPSTTAIDMGVIESSTVSVLLDLEALTPVLTVTSGSNGSISCTRTEYLQSSTTVVSAGSTQQLTLDYNTDVSYVVTPATDYEISTLLVDGSDPRS